MDFESILYEKKGRVVVITLNRPEVLNAVGPKTGAELIQAFHQAEDDDGVLAVEVASHVLSEVRKSKSEAQRPLKTPVRRVLVRGPAAHLSALALVESDLRAAGLIERLEETSGDVLDVEVELADAAAAKGASA